MICARRLAALFLAAACMAGAVAYAETPTAATTPLELTITGGASLNPNASGRPSPVVVRIFQLTAAKTFDAADYLALFERPAESLKKELLVVDEFVLRPGEAREYNRPLTPDVKVLAVAAAFRDIANASWHLAVPVKAGRRNAFVIHLDQTNIQIDTAGQR